jgi:Tfp pilus assembly protein PilV
MGKGQRGTTLIETMIATAICMVVVFGLAGLVTMSTKQSKDMGSTVAQASTLAAWKIDDLMTRAWTNAEVNCSSGTTCGSITANTSGYVEYLTATGTTTTATAANLFFTRRWRVEHLNSSPTTIKRITVWVGGRAIGTSSEASQPSATLATIRAMQ